MDLERYRRKRRRFPWLWVLLVPLLCCCGGPLGLGIVQYLAMSPEERAAAQAEYQQRQAEWDAERERDRQQAEAEAAKRDAEEKAAQLKAAAEEQKRLAAEKAAEARRKRFGDEYEAMAVAADFVTDHLKAPSTAKFSSGKREHRVTTNGTGQWTVSGWVDAQNSFGAMLRSRWTVVLQCTGDEKYRLVSIDIDDP